MKASELNGTHLGHRVTLSLEAANLSDTLTGVTHTAALVNETPICSNENSTGLGMRHTNLAFQHLGTVNVAPEASVTVLTEDERQPLAPRPARNTGHSDDNR